MAKGARKSSFKIDHLYFSIILSKAGVIEFFASDKAFSIYNKSKWHKRAIQIFRGNWVRTVGFSAVQIRD
jgi:hypothetical protein